MYPHHYKSDVIHVRLRKLKSGARSVNLAYKVDGKRIVECLKMYILPGSSPDVQRHNDHVMRAAMHIKAQRLKNIAWSKDANAGLKESRMFINEIIDAYAEKKKNQGYRSCVSHCQALKTHLDAFKPNMRLWQISTSFVTRFFMHLTKTVSDTTGKPLAKATVGNIHYTLNAVMNHAVTNGWIAANPLDKMDSSIIKGEVAEREYLTKEEQNLLAKTPCPYDEAVKQVFMFACFVGLRISDLRSLKWKEIVNEDGVRAIHKKMKKTDHMVYVPLSETALSYLPEKGRANSKVFSTLPKNDSDINQVIKKWTKDAGIEKNITFHCSRHTFATNLLTVGNDLYTTSELMGHKCIESTEGYAKIINRKKEEAVEKIDKLFEKYLDYEPAPPKPFTIEHDKRIEIINKRITKPMIKRYIPFPYAEKELEGQAPLYELIERLYNCDMDVEECFLEATILYLKAFNEVYDYHIVSDVFIQAFSKYLTNEAVHWITGEPLHKVTCITILQTLKDAIFYELDHGWDINDPIRRFSPKAQLLGTCFSRKNLSRQEFEMLEGTPCRHPWLKDMFLFACHSGLLLHEMKEATWSWIHLHDDAPYLEKPNLPYSPKQIGFSTESIKYLPKEGEAQALVYADIPLTPEEIKKELNIWAFEAGLQREMQFRTARETYKSMFA